MPKPTTIHPAAVLGDDVRTAIEKCRHHLAEANQRLAAAQMALPDGDDWTLELLLRVGIALTPASIAATEVVDHLDGFGAGLLRPGQVAERLNVCGSDVQKWIRAEQCPAVRVGRKVRIPESWVDEQAAVAAHG